MKPLSLASGLAFSTWLLAACAPAALPASAQPPSPFPTSTLFVTSTPTFTPTPSFSEVNMNDDGKGRQWCEPDTVRAGRIVVWRAIGRWPAREEAITALGEAWPPIEAGGRPLEVTPLERSDVEWHSNGPDDPTPGWGFHASVEIRLDPGVYDLSSRWLHDLKTCTLTVR